MRGRGAEGQRIILEAGSHLQAPPTLFYVSVSQVSTTYTHKVGTCPKEGDDEPGLRDEVAMWKPRWGVMRWQFLP